MRGLLPRLFDTLALSGTLALLAAAALMTVSVGGRALFDTPLDGDYEFVKLALGFAAFAVLPLTEARGGHVAADSFTARLSGRAQARLEAFWHLVQGAVFLLLAGAMVPGALATFSSGETTMQRQIPLWPGVALASLLCALAALAALGRARRLLRRPSA